MSTYRYEIPLDSTGFIPVQYQVRDVTGRGFPFMNDNSGAGLEDLRAQLLAHFDGAARNVSISRMPGNTDRLEAEIELVHKSCHCRLRSHFRMQWFLLLRFGEPDLEYRFV